MIDSACFRDWTLFAISARPWRDIGIARVAPVFGFAEVVDFLFTRRCNVAATRCVPLAPIESSHALMNCHSSGSR